MSKIEDPKEWMHVCKCEDDTISIIIPYAKTRLNDEEWCKLHQFDEISEIKSLHHLQLPGERSERNSWKLEEDGVIV